ncbi:MAG: aminotransferase class IV [Pseudomonadota bacterium]
MATTVFLNGRWCPPEDAMVSVNDRGFLFGDAVYEATPAYGGRFLRLERHMTRLQQGLDALRIAADVRTIERCHFELLERNDLRREPWSMVYLQVTRGVAPRGHAFPAGDVQPTVYGFARALTRPDRARWQAGYAAITYPDLRWRRADLKTTLLLANVLAQQAAVDAGVDDVILLRDSMAVEGSHANLFIVSNGALVTAPLDERVLPGVTRSIVIELAAGLSLEVHERDVSEADLRTAAEVLLCGTTTEIRPITSVNGEPVGGGAVGPITRQLYDAFQQHLLTL